MSITAETAQEHATLQYYAAVPKRAQYYPLPI